MSANIRDYAKLAAEIRDQVGEQNIVSAAHCATRLRLVLRESPPAEVTRRISELPAVIQVLERGGQYQIVIGVHAKDVYEELVKLLRLDQSAQPAQKQGILARVIATMSAVFAPFVYILAAAGLVQGALILLAQWIPAFPDTGTYAVLSFISWTPFTFLPAMIAVTASKHFKCNTFIAMWCCLALVNADWGALAARIAGGETIRFLIFPMAQTTYTSTVLPPLFLVLVLSYLERFLDRRLPDVLKAIGTPFLCAVIMVPLTILVIGPLSDAAANGIAVAYNQLARTVPMVAGALVGGIWEIFVIFGVHWGVTPMNIANFNANGRDTFQAFQTCAVVAQAAACFGVVLKTRRREMRRVAFSAGLTGIFGITEPAIYGVTLPLKKPFICGCVGGAVGAIVLSLFDTMYYVYAGLPGLLTTVNAISAQNPMSFPGMLLGTLATIVVTIALVQVVGCGESPGSGDAADAAPSGPVRAPAPGEAGEVTVCSPLSGTVVPLSQVKDPTFAQGILGEGAAVQPREGKLYAPFDGTVLSIADSRHAVHLLGPNQMELLLHIGLDTVELGGAGYTARVKEGDRIRTGDLLVEFDLEEIRRKYDPITPVLVTNAEDFTAVELWRSGGLVEAGEPLLRVRNEQDGNLEGTT